MRLRRGLTRCFAKALCAKSAPKVRILLSPPLGDSTAVVPPPLKRRVVGSNPTPPANFMNTKNYIAVIILSSILFFSCSKRNNFITIEKQNYFLLSNATTNVDGTITPALYEKPGVTNKYYILSLSRTYMIPIAR